MRASPQFDVVANSPIHNHAMLSLASEREDILPYSALPPLPTAFARSIIPLPSDTDTSPGCLNFSLQLLESQSHSIRLAIRAKEQDKTTPKSYGRHFNSIYFSYQDARILGRGCVRSGISGWVGGCTVSIPEFFSQGAQGLCKKKKKKLRN